MQAIGMDIGGAHLKISDAFGNGHEIDFPFWKRHQEFGQQLQQIASDIAKGAVVGITMTAELADCFESRQQGVQVIVDQVDRHLGRFHPRYYQTNGRLVDAAIAKRDWRMTAASNWHASSSFLFQSASLWEGFFVDIGSTTSDFIPMRNGCPVNNELTDFDRLKTGQLVYAGIGRTPVFGLVDHLQLAEDLVPVARETFATIDDALLLLGDRAEAPTECHSADERPRTKHFAAKRLARMLCLDAEELNHDSLMSLAEQVKASLVKKLRRGLTQVRSNHPDLPLTFGVAGSGTFLLSELVQKDTAIADHNHVGSLRIHQYEGNDSQLLPAHAVAVKRMNMQEQGKTSTQKFR